MHAYIWVHPLAGNGTVRRMPVAEVVINVNSSEVIFKNNVTRNSLWQGIVCVVVEGHRHNISVISNPTTCWLLWTVADGVPYDGAAVEVLHTNHEALMAIYSIAASAGLVYATLCLLFNVIFRKRKWVHESLSLQWCWFIIMLLVHTNYRVVKLSSPNLNYLIIAGAALLYISVFLYVFSAQNRHQAVLQTLLCNVCDNS